MALIPHLSWAVITLGLLTGCHQPEPSTIARVSGAPELAAGDMGYLAPPRATGVVARHDGLRIVGLAPPYATVEIDAPEGDQKRAQADRRGVWTLTLPADRARLYAISALIGPRTLHAEGALVTAPGAVSQAVMVRAGYAALILISKARLNIAALDYDPQGAIAVAGDAPPGAKLSLSVDGAAAAVGQAGPHGRYALMAANRRLAFGVHTLEMRGVGQAVAQRVVLEPPSPLTAPYQAWRTAQGWRVEWALNGGGVQTTLVMSPDLEAAGPIRPAS